MNGRGHGRTFVPGTGTNVPEGNGEFSTLGRMREDGAEGKLIKAHQRELAGGRDEIKECRPLVPCARISFVPDLRTTALHGGMDDAGIQCTNTHTHTSVFSGF